MRVAVAVRAKQRPRHSATVPNAPDSGNHGLGPVLGEPAQLPVHPDAVHAAAGPLLEEGDVEARAEGRERSGRLRVELWM